MELSNTTSEYNTIKQLFQLTMKGYSVLKIQRIQNPSLWKVFQWSVFVSSSLWGGSLQELVSCICILGKERHYRLCFSVTGISFLGAISGVTLSVLRPSRECCAPGGRFLFHGSLEDEGGGWTERHERCKIGMRIHTVMRNSILLLGLNTNCLLHMPSVCYKCLSIRL